MRSERCEKCPHEHTERCETCNPNEEAHNDLDDLMYDIGEKFLELRAAVRRRYFGIHSDAQVKEAAKRLSENCKQLTELMDEGGTGNAEIDIHG
jgi:hypothetical protein